MGARANSKLAPTVLAVGSIATSPFAICDGGVWQGCDKKRDLGLHMASETELEASHCYPSFFTVLEKRFLALIMGICYNRVQDSTLARATSCSSISIVLLPTYLATSSSRTPPDIPAHQSG